MEFDSRVNWKEAYKYRIKIPSHVSAGERHTMFLTELGEVWATGVES